MTSLNRIAKYERNNTVNNFHTLTALEDDGSAATTSTESLPFTSLARLLPVRRLETNATTSAADQRACPSTPRPPPDPASANRCRSGAEDMRRRGVEVDRSGRKTAPHTTMLSNMAEQTTRVPRHRNLRINQSVRGANTNVPMPDPATASPVYRTHTRIQH